MTTKKHKTAAELMAELNRDPEFRARAAAKEAERVRRELELEHAEAPLVKELCGAGFSVRSVWDLVNTADPYPAAIPILFAHLVREYPPPVREGIARALAVPETRAGWSMLTRLFRDETSSRVKDALAVALAVAADESVIEDVKALVLDPQHGPSRLLLLDALSQAAHPLARSILERAAKDPELAKEAQRLLRTLQNS